MTTREPSERPHRDPGWSYEYREYPPCSCGKPECSDHAVKISIHYTEQDPATTHMRPLTNPYAAEINALVLDVLNGRVGILVDRAGGKSKAVFVRGENGYEWETDSRYLERPPAPPGKLAEKIATRNRDSDLTDTRLPRRRAS
ncbi:hypothetical protein ACFV84_01865 [Kitasatospora sp. NPDC059811]|uniref:hypothetical protein n=1 Tax=Kitasatospora sp. NPDC059811 TaxID=3346957 RepID=UPI0036543324